MVLASYAVAYNFLLGYTGLMSLGHAMFFASGMYAAGLGIYYLELSASRRFTFWCGIYSGDFTDIRTVCPQNKRSLFSDSNPDVWSNILFINSVFQRIHFRPGWFFTGEIFRKISYF